VALPRLRLAADKLATGAGAAVAVPLRFSVALGLVELVVAMVKVPARAPVAAGVNTTVAEQLLPTAMTPPAVQLPPTENSAALAPPTVRPLKVSDAVPLLPSVTVCCALLPSAVAAKVSDDWFKVSVPLGMALPVPLRLTVPGVPAALWATLKVAPRAPVAEGVNTNLTTQLLLGATLVPAAQVVPLATA
jgi:hypothetical protein